MSKKKREREREQKKNESNPFIKDISSPLSSQEVPPKTMKKPDYEEVVQS